MTGIFIRRQALGRLERLLDQINGRRESSQTAPLHNLKDYIISTSGDGDEKAFACAGSVC